MKILATLPKDRLKLGILRLLSDAGQEITAYSVYAKADTLAAVSHNNPSRDPLKPFGDTPTGEYTALYITQDFTPGPQHDEHIEGYGPHGVFVLSPISGDALKAKQNSRRGLMIHGGDLNAQGKLRPTYGCLRLSNDNVGDLVTRVTGAGLKSLPCSVIAEVSLEPPTG